MNRTSKAPRRPLREGDRVVCIDGSATTCHGRQELVQGQFYTVEAVVDRRPCLIETFPKLAQPCVILREVGGVCCEVFPARRFKRVPSIEIFQRMLTKVTA